MEIIVIVLNGEPHQVSPSSTLTDLVEALNLSQKAIAVAVNRTIIARHQWGEYQLQAQDQVDVVRAIGGG
jgi:sulfur carrier protein